MRKERYEEKISDLETRIDSQKSVIEDLQKRIEKADLKAARQHEDFSKGLAKFLSQIYSDLSSVQAGIARQMAALQQMEADRVEKRGRDFLELIGSDNA